MKWDEYEDGPSMGEEAQIQGLIDELTFGDDPDDDFPIDPERWWVTRDGRALMIEDMEDSHLVNTIMLLRRTHEYRVFVESRGALLYAAQAPDGAAMAAENAADEMLECSPAEFEPRLAVMYAECLKRGIPLVDERIQTEHEMAHGLKMILNLYERTKQANLNTLRADERMAHD